MNVVVCAVWLYKSFASLGNEHNNSYSMKTNKTHRLRLLFCLRYELKSFFFFFENIFYRNYSLNQYNSLKTKKKKKSQNYLKENFV